MMTYKQIIHPFKNTWQVIGAMWVLNTITSLLFWRNAFNSWETFGIASIWGTTIWITQAMGHRTIFALLDEVFPWRDGLFKRAFFTVISIGTYATVAYFLVQLTMFYLFVDDFTLQKVWHETSQSVWTTMAIAYSISFVLTFFGFARALVDTTVEKEKLQTQMMSYKYESLKQQINPHFLFNSFNVLSELVYENQDMAVNFIRELSDIYRYVLDSNQKELVSIKDELGFIESFLHLLTIRFENRVEFKVNIQKSDDLYIIPLALQLLVENAIKHNESTAKRPLTIELNEDENSFSVRNNKQLKNTGNTSTKIGLQNLQERYTYFSDQEIIIEDAETYFEVRLPKLLIDDVKTES